jgi:hypothetical protein
MPWRIPSGGGFDYCLREAASWGSVSVNALTAASRYWPMPVRPWIIFVAPVLNWVYEASNCLLEASVT